ncbi:hypothetical protein [Streptomyces sp. RTGN2]|uniref:hypothetical protein n=2 Tax=unclassified Streptomyces TaxID=2593676 RepID=UPI002553C88C|nr:hypothetical protein [Streptomyces sp. RTGN2]
MMAQVVDGRAADRVGAAPSSVSMAVLCVVMPALAPALSWTGLIGGASPGGLLLPLALVIGLPLLVGASALLTAVYILPTVALGHWLGRLAGHGRKWWYALAGTAVGLLPVVGLHAVARMSQSGIHGWGRLAADGLLAAAALWVASAPASIAVHVTVLREEAGRPVRPVGGILLWGTLGLTVEGTAWVMCL